MSKWVPRDEYVKSLTAEQLRDFYVKSDPRKKAPAKRSYARASSYQPGVRGRGAYANEGKKIRAAPKYGKVRNAPKDASFDSSYGSRLGSVIGEGVQSFANALGFGEYNIQQNSCLKMVDLGTSPPRVKNTNKGEAMVINHREYVGDMTTGAFMPNSTSTAFKIETYKINPGNSTLFPFTSLIAANFQEWEIRGMLVELKSLSSNTATSLSLGSMFAATDYNVYDAPPVNKIEIENLEYACSNKPTESILMPVECARKNDVLTHLYIDSGQPDAGDRRLYDIGNLFLGSYGCPQANAPIAEVWVTYEIALYKPHIHVMTAPDPTEIATLGAHFWGNFDVTSTPWNVPLGLNTFVGAANNSLGALVYYDSDTSQNMIHFPRSSEQKWYSLTCVWRTQGTISAPAIPQIGAAPPSGGVTILGNPYSGISADHMQTHAQASNANSVMLQIMVTVPPHDNDNFNAITLTNGTIGVAGSKTFWDLIISELPAGGVVQYTTPM